MLKDFFALLFPPLCAGCENVLYKDEQSLCLSCIYLLPKTNFHLQKDNAVEKIFWGRTNIQSAASYYNFVKDGKVQNIIHQLKYRGERKVGVFVGNLYGNELKKSEGFNTIDYIIPVPLHKRKKMLRGYNQSEAFAEGLAESMNVKTDFTTLFRAKESESQTRKTRYKRWENVENIFQINDFAKLQASHILLVDDVVTTGATLEACANVLLTIPDVTISIATMAYSTN